MRPELTTEGVRQMAAVAGLDLDPERAARLLPQLQAVLEALDAVQEMDLEGVEPATVFSLERFAPHPDDV
jgi:Asp-tRNA(Asn)/Glu-tRNA(Gln) amidotransferase C subunit